MTGMSCIPLFLAQLISFNENFRTLFRLSGDVSLLRSNSTFRDREGHMRFVHWLSEWFYKDTILQ